VKMAQLLHGLAKLTSKIIPSHKRLLRESEFLEKYFSTPAGIGTIIHLFFQAEVDELIEPAGII